MSEKDRTSMDTILAVRGGGRPEVRKGYSSFLRPLALKDFVLGNAFTTEAIDLTPQPADNVTFKLDAVIIKGADQSELGKIENITLGLYYQQYPNGKQICFRYFRANVTTKTPFSCNDTGFRFRFYVADFQTGFIESVPKWEWRPTNVNFLCGDKNRLIGSTVKVAIPQPAETFSRVASADCTYEDSVWQAC